MISMRDLLNSKTFRKMFSSFSIYTGFNFMNQAIPFMLIPILTRLLSLRDYGILATFTALMSTVNVIISMGTTDAVARAFFDKDDKGSSFSKFIFNAVTINFAVFIIFCSIMLICRCLIATASPIPLGWLYILPVIGLCAAVSGIPYKLLVFKKKPVSYATIELSNTTIEIVISIVLVALGFSWTGRVLGIGIANTLFFILALYILAKDYIHEYVIDPVYMKKILAYGIPVVFHSLGFSVVTMVPMIFLNKLVGLSATGLYSTAFSFASVIGFFIGAFSLAWSPFFYERLGRADPATKTLLVRATYLFFILMLCIAFMVAFIMPYIVKIFVGKDFYGAGVFIFWLSLAFAAHGMYVIVAGYIFYSKKTYFLVISAIITIALCVLFNNAFIRMNGAIGAAQATFLTFLCKFILFWYIGNRVHPMPWFKTIKLKAV